MPDIKTRESVKDIKILDKANVAGERMKKAFIAEQSLIHFMVLVLLVYVVKN